jgi:uncharacterized membrane protein required for colicin V production
MTIWLLVLILLASVAALGYRQGAIRVAVSFLGIVLASFLAVPLGKLIQPLLKGFGLKDPVMVWALAPVIVFVVISVLFKAGALPLHQRIDVYYKYRAGELRYALWERINRRLGLCLGLLNGTVYLILISFGIYIFSYWTVQVASSDTDPKAIRLLNRLGNDLQSTGFSKVARSIDSLPSRYYDMADFVGLIYRNSLLEARLGCYPPFLKLAEMPEFQTLGNDTQFIQMRQGREPIMGVLNHQGIANIINNRELMATLWGMVDQNLEDLRAYLETGQSRKYPEVIFGRWRFNINAAISATRRAKPNISSTEMQKIRRWITSVFEKTTFVAMTGGQALLKNAPPLRAGYVAVPTANQTFQGEWKAMTANKYLISFPSGGVELQAVVEGDRMTMTGEGVTPMVFNPLE